MPPGSTVDIEKAEKPEDGTDDEREVKINITKPVKKREKVGVGAEGGEPSEGEDLPEGQSGDGEESLPDEPEVLPDVPDAPPSSEDEGSKE